MTALGVLILTSSISMASIDDGSAKDGLKAIAKASYIQSGMDKNVKRLEKRYMPEVVKDYGGYVAFVYKLGYEKKVSIEWSF